MISYIKGAIDDDMDKNFDTLHTLNNVTVLFDCCYFTTASTYVKMT
ncbi:hypothetical protein [Candidatus Hartigia pinicola]